MNKSQIEDSLSREQMIIKHLPFVKRIVNGIAAHIPRSVETEDLINAGVIGLIQAVERFDPTRNNKFATFATFRIKGAVLSELRNRDFLSRTHRKKIREMEKTCFKLEQKLGRQAHDDEVAEELGLDFERFYSIKRMSKISFVSFEEIGCYHQEERTEIMNGLFNIENGSEDALALTKLKELKNAVAKAIEFLPKKEKLIVALYYQDELTMKEIGKVLDLTESRVSQLHSKVIMSIRKRLIKHELIDDRIKQTK